MGIENFNPVPNDSKRIDDKVKAEEMAHNSDPAHTTVSIHRERGASDVEQREKNAEEDEERAALWYDEKKRAEAMTDAEISSAFQQIERETEESQRQFTIAVEAGDEAEKKEIIARDYRNQPRNAAITQVMLERQKK